MDEQAESERAYARVRPHLWPWTGWHAVIVGSEFVGVFPDVEAAVAAAIWASPSAGAETVDVMVRRIGGRSAVAAPPADGGVAGRIAPSRSDRRAA